MDYPDQYFNRTDPSKEYEEHLFIPGRGMQAAELNEIQSTASNRLRGIADVLFKDGAIVRDAAIVVDVSTGAARCASGAIYLRGAVRGVQPSTFTIPMGVVAVGVRLVQTVITSLEDPTLRDPATGTRNYDERGAERLKVHAQWGWDGDGGEGEFFPVYGVIDRLVSAKEPPPNLDAVTQALARYDRDSAGGSYVISGMTVTKLTDAGDDQAYSIAEGRARVYGYAIEFPTSRRVIFDANPDLLQITDEPHLSASAAAQRINFDRVPGTNLSRVSITAEKTVTLTHGVVTGAKDPLPDTSVLQIIEVKQGGTTFVPTTDYLLTAGQVDWAPAGGEPAPGSTYTVKYRYITLVTPTAVDDTGFTVTGAVVGTVVLADYKQKLPRFDRLCLDVDGQPVWITGTANAFFPQLPTVPQDLLPLATIYQSWTADRPLTNDGVRVVPMQYLAGLEGKIDYVLQRVASQQLESDIHTREGGTKKGLFVDPFLDDSQRDAGTAQTAAIVNGILTLPISVVISQMSTDVVKPEAISYASSPVLSQPLKTTAMKINPYLSFAAPPAKVTLTPAVDRWTEVQTTWASSITSRVIIDRSLVQRAADPVEVSRSTRTVTLSSTSTNIETLRRIEVKFSIAGFAPGEALSSVTFDGIPVTPVAQ